MNNIIKSALEVADDIEALQIEKCAPDDDPTKQYAYSAAFRDMVIKFIGYVRRIQDGYLQEWIIGIEDDLDLGLISVAHAKKARIIVMIDYLRELQQTPGYIEKVNVNQCFVDKLLIEKLKVIKSDKFDLQKLIRYIEELNDSYKIGNYISSLLLIRAIINHIPPIFGKETFIQVVESSKRSIKSILSIFEDSARPVADLFTHMTIRKKESLPSNNQVDPYKSAFEVLVNEIIYQISEA